MFSITGLVESCYSQNVLDFFFQKAWTFVSGDKKNVYTTKEEHLNRFDDGAIDLNFK